MKSKTLISFCILYSHTLKDNTKLLHNTKLIPIPLYIVNILFLTIVKYKNSPIKSTKRIIMNIYDFIVNKRQNDTTKVIIATFLSFSI